MSGLPKMTYLILAVLFVIQMETSFGLEPPENRPTLKDSRVYWNVPTQQCHQHGINFDEVSQQFHIRQNPKDEFSGAEITMLYDPGMFPALYVGREPRNGGVPQAGDLGIHLEAFKEKVEQLIPDVSYRGLAIIDFEKWRPIFRQNWGSLKPYNDLSKNLVQTENPQLSLRQVRAKARQRFETSGKTFMEETLKLAVITRPGATWGYYGFPYCYNWTPGNNKWSCESKVLKDNDAMSWLFMAQNVTLPSVYISLRLSPKRRISLIRGRVTEAMRIARKSNPRKKVLVFIWFKYQHNDDVFLSSEDLANGIREINDLGADGYVIWGSSNDVNTKEKCEGLHRYLKDVLGPAILKAEERMKQKETTSDHEAEHVSNLEEDQSIPQVLMVR